MARITVDDCLKHIHNRFQLVLVATRRARQLTQGTKPLVPDDKDKATVIALREIAAGLIDESVLEDKPRPEEDVLRAAASDAEPVQADADTHPEGQAAD